MRQPKEHNTSRKLPLNPSKPTQTNQGVFSYTLTENTDGHYFVDIQALFTELDPHKEFVNELNDAVMVVVQKWAHPRLNRKENNGKL